jgi:hypothetical protein
MARDYEVGYGKPPKTSRFKRGQSGNPKGRPKGRRNLATEFKTELSKLVTVRENGESRRVSKRVAILKSLLAKALSGDVKAITAVFDRALDIEHEHQSVSSVTVEADEIRLAKYFGPRAVKSPSGRRGKS